MRYVLADNLIGHTLPRATCSREKYVNIRSATAPGATVLVTGHAKVFASFPSVHHPGKSLKLRHTNAIIQHTSLV